MFGRMPDPEQERLRAKGRQFQQDREALTSRLVPGSQNYGRSFEDMITALASSRDDGNAFDLLEELKSGTADDPAGENIVPNDEYERIRNMEMLKGMVNRALFQRMAKRGKFGQPSQGGYMMSNDQSRKWTR